MAARVALSVAFAALRDVLLLDEIFAVGDRAILLDGARLVMDGALSDVCDRCTETLTERTSSVA